MATATAVDEYLAGVAYDEIAGWDTCPEPDGPIGERVCNVFYTPYAGSGPAAAPGAETIWEESVEGTGLLTLDWTLPSGTDLTPSSAEDAVNDRGLVVMNADGSPGVTADLAFGAKASNAAAILLMQLVAAGTVMLAGALAVAASVMRLGGWMIGLGLAVVVFGAVGFGLLYTPAAGAVILLGLVLMIIGMTRSWHAQRSDPTTLVEANEPVPSS